MEEEKKSTDVYMNKYDHIKLLRSSCIMSMLLTERIMYGHFTQDYTPIVCKVIHDLQNHICNLKIKIQPELSTNYLDDLMYIKNMLNTILTESKYINDPLAKSLVEIVKSIHSGEFERVYARCMFKGDLNNLGYDIR